LEVIISNFCYKFEEQSYLFVVHAV